LSQDATTPSVMVSLNLGIRTISAIVYVCRVLLVV
jgi:hypothetical protein